MNNAFEYVLRWGHLKEMLKLIKSLYSHLTNIYLPEQRGVRNPAPRVDGHVKADPVTP